MNKSLTLYEITEQYRSALDFLANTPEEEIDMDSFAAQLANLQSDLNSTAAAVGCYIREVEAESAAIKEWLKFQQDRARRLDSTATRLRNYLLGELKLAGIKNVKDLRIVINIRKNPPRVKITDENLLPSEYRRTHIVSEPDKWAIKDILNSGCTIPGAELETIERLEIK
jgi:hypothetical protein